MKKTLALILATALVALAAPTAATASSTFLSVRAAKHALRVNLKRAFGISHVYATCRRRSRVKLSCHWRGRRGGTPYKGSAVVIRDGGGIAVRLSHVRRA